MTRYFLDTIQWLKWSCEAGGGAHLTKPGWSNPILIPHPTNLALFGHKVTLYRFNQVAHNIAGGSNRSMGAEPPNHLTLTTDTIAILAGSPLICDHVTYSSRDIKPGLPESSIALTNETY